MSDNCDNCTHDNCLCDIETNHNNNLKIKENNSNISHSSKNNVWAEIYKDQSESTFRNNPHDKNRIDDAAEAIQRYHKFVTLRKTDEILEYDGKIYNSNKSKSIIKEETEKLLYNCTEHDRNEVLSKIKVQSYTDIELFDSDPSLITLLNGILNLDSLELTSHTSKNLSRVLYPVEYHEPLHDIDDDNIFECLEDNLKNTLFWKSLKSCFTIDGYFRKEDFETILEMIASVFIKKQVDERAFINLGGGNNGKSVVLEYIESLLGRDNVSRIALHEISEDKFMAAELESKLVNVYADLENNELRKTGKLKQIVSGEGIQVQRKYSNPFQLYPFCKLVFSCNRFPKVYDQTQGFFRRWIIVKWERNFENDPQRDEHLKENLKNNREEKNLVFSCLVRLAKKLKKTGKFTHSKDWREIQKTWNANADPLDDFATNYIIESDGSKTKRETYQFYKAYCYEKGESPLGMGQFGKRFAEYYEDSRDGGNRTWLNIDFRKPKDTLMKDFQ